MTRRRQDKRPATTQILVSHKNSRLAFGACGFAIHCNYIFERAALSI